MTLQFFTVHKRMAETIHNNLLLRSQTIGIRRINGGEVHIFHRIIHITDANSTFFKIDLIQKQSVIHLKLRILLNQLTFQLKLYDHDCFVHLHIKFKIFFVIAVIIFDGKKTAVCVRVSIECKCSERNQVDSVTFFQNIQISITGGNTNYICNTAGLTACCSHPHNIMISPLNIHRMILAKCIHDNMRTFSSVIDVADIMEMINYQLLDQIAERNDKIRCASNAYDCMNNLIIISFLIMNLFLFSDKFLDYIGKIRRKCSSHFRTCIFGSNPLGQLNQTVKGNLEPVFQVFLVLFLLHDQFQFFFRVINQSCQASLIPRTQGISEFFVNFPLYTAGTVFQHMVELFGFPMNIGEEMFRSFRQAHDCLQINDFRGCIRYCRKLLRQTFQIHKFQFTHNLLSPIFY